MIYLDLRDKIYDSLALIFPTTQIIQAYGNGPEPETTYVEFDIAMNEQEGREYISTFANANGEQQIISHFVPRVRFDFIGKQDDETEYEAAQLAEDFYFKLNYTTVQENFLKNALSYMRKSSLRRVPKKRETDWYISYQFDVFFGYQVEARQDIDIIETVELTGTYNKPDGSAPIIVTQTIN